MSIVSDILTKHGNTIVDKLRDSLRQKGLNASGETRDSIKFDLIKEQFFDILEISANLSLMVLEEGRKPNIHTTGELRPAIERWIETKPIRPLDAKTTKEQLVYLIVRKIATEGIKVPNKHNPGGVVSDVITSDLINRIFNEALTAHAEDYVQTIKRAI